MSFSVSPFGELKGQSIDLYTLSNDNGMKVKIMSYGATITSISMPCKNGKSQNIVCGFDTFEAYFSDEYKQNAPYFGCTVGRYAARIKDGKFKLNGKDYQLSCNDGDNHLHGGIQAFDKMIWDVEPMIKNKGESGIKFTLNIKDEHENYPGALTIDVTYTLTKANQLRIDYHAQSDADTPLSLTNHTYFNLGGFEDTILDHHAQINSKMYLTPDESNVPCGKLSPLCEVTDFQTPKLIGDAFTKLPQGFEHYYIFEDTSKELKSVAHFSHSASGRKLEVQSTEPGMLFYTAYYTSDNLQRESGEQFGQFRAFCCETSKYPNGPNIVGSPRSILKAGETYSETTQFNFSTEHS